MICNQLIYDLPNKEYHGGEGIYSSSQMKAMIEDPEVFYKKYITKELEQKRIAAFDIGTYFHTAILEPHKLEEECAVFTGGIRRGREWDAFLSEHGNKAIITQAEYETAQKMIEAVKASPICMGVLNGSKSEVSASIVIYVYSNSVFTIKDNELYRLFLGGWCKDQTDIEEVLEWGTRVQIKARADSINVDRGIVSDLKSTTGNVKSLHEVKTTVASYDYDLSAAFYMDIFSMCAGRTIEAFIWIFASKDAGVAKAYQASTDSIKVGRAKWRKAAIDLAFYINRDWKFTDSLGEISPVLYNMEWLSGE
jgi:hypothetical protein